MSSRALSTMHEGSLRTQGQDIAGNLLTYVEVIIGTNQLRYADINCFNLIDPVAGCSDNSARMNGVYASHFDIAHLTPALILVNETTIDDDAVLDRLPNDSSFHLVATDAGEDTKILTGNMSGSEPTNFYGQLTLEPLTSDVGVLATATVKWPVHSDVRTIKRTRIFTPIP